MCNLLAGNYYLNIVIKALINGEKVFLSRIVDATVFKVQKNPVSNYTGIFEFDKHLEIIPIKSKNNNHLFAEK